MIAAMQVAISARSEADLRNAKETLNGGDAVLTVRADVRDAADAQRLVDETVKRFGGLDVLVRRNAFGRQVDSFESDVDFAEVEGGPMHAVFIRAPWVEKVGEDVEVLARVPAADRGEGIGHAADGRIVAVRQGSLLATSFHPEITGDGRVHELFVSIVRDSR